MIKGIPVLLGRIKAVLILGGLYIWLNWIFLSLALLLSLFGFKETGSWISDIPGLSYFFMASFLFVLLIDFDFSKYLSHNQVLFFMYTGWLPYLYYLLDSLKINQTDLFLLLFLFSSCIAVSQFSGYSKIDKGAIIFIVLALYGLSLIGI